MASILKQSVKNNKRYDQNYLYFSFIHDVEEHSQCVICFQILASFSMKCNKLKSHLQTRHKKFIKKPKKFFIGKLDHFKSTEQNFTKTTSVPSKTLLELYLVSQGSHMQ